MGSQIDSVQRSCLSGFMRVLEGVEPAAGLEATARMIDGLHVPVITFDTSGCLMSFNAGAEALYGYSAAEVVGSRGFGTLAGDDEELTASVVESLIAGEPTGTAVLHHRRADNSPVDVILVGTRIHDAAGAVLGVLATVHEFTPSSIVQRRLSETEVELRSAARALTTLSHSAAVIVDSRDEETLLRKMCRMAVELGGYRLAIVAMVRDDADKSLEIVASAGEGADLLAAMKPTYGDDPKRHGPAVRAVRERRPIAVNRVRAKIMGAAVYKAYATLGVRSVIVLPLIGRDGEPLGILGIYADEPDQFDADEVRLLTELAASLGYAIENRRIQLARDEADSQLRQANEQLHSMLSDIVVTFGRVIEARDPYTQGHQERVAEISRAIAQEMGLAAEQVDCAVTAALLHDVGKLAVPAEILNAQGRLGEIEMLLVRKHPEAGREILSQIAFPCPIAEIVAQHHERWDGSGYPEGIAGEAIRLEARIIAVADVVAAMTEDRAHRRAPGLDAAAREIREHRERFDPKVVEALNSLWERGALEL